MADENFNGKKEPERCFLHRDDLTLENVLALYTLLTGKPAREEELPEQLEMWKPIKEALDAAREEERRQGR